MELSIDPIHNESEILFIDGAINDIEHLVSGVSSSTEIFILDTEKDGIAQIGEVLAERNNISSVHIVSFGTPGSLQLGSANLGADNLNTYNSALSAWANTLTADADILLYGCNVAAGGDTTLLQQLSGMTGADIAASDDLTGNATLGGDWDLEMQVGDIETALAFSTDVMSGYQHVFDTFRIEDIEIAEGDSGTTEAIFIVTLDEALEEVATVDFNTSNLSAIAGEDYEETSDTLTFEAGETTGEIRVPIIGDTESEDDEAFAVILSNASENANVEEGERAIATILDDDALMVLADNIQVAEGSDAIFNLRLSAAAEDPVTVEFTTRAASGDNAATPDEDFQTTSDAVTFNPGETEQTVIVSTIDNPDLNLNRTFLLALTSAEGAEIDNPQIEATILDNDLSISGSKWNDLDGDGMRDAGEPGLAGVTIYLDINDNGQQDGDEPFTATNEEGNYTFTNLTPGEYVVREQAPRGFAQTFPVGELTEIGTPSPQEPTEPIQFGSVNLATPDGDGSVRLTVDAFGAFGSNVGTTADAFFDPIGDIVEAGTTYESGVALRAGDSGTRTFLTTGDIQGSGQLADPGFVEISGDADSETTNRAVSRFNFNGLDLTLTQTVRELFLSDGTRSGSLLTQTYSIFNPGSDTANFEFVRYFDGDLDFDGSLIDGGGRLQTGGQEILFETDTAGEPATSTTFIGITGTGGSAAQPGRFEIDAFPEFAQRIIAGEQLDDTITGDDTGEEPDDDEFVDEGQGFDLTLGFRNGFNLDPGASTVYTTTTIFGSGAPDDIQLSEDGFYRLTLNPLEPIEGADFANTEVPFPDITVQEEARVTEGNPVDPDPDDPDAPTPTNRLNFTVSLSEPTSVPVNVNFSTADGSATAGDDYQSTAGTLTFAPGETQKTVSVPIIPDTDIEPDETLFLRLSDPDNGRLAIAQGVGIIESDDLPTVSINNLGVTEGNSGANDAAFEVNLSAASSQPITLNFNTVEGTATGGSDYQIVSGSLTFNPGEVSKTIAVPIFGDVELESDETFFLRLSEVTNARPSVVEGTVTIFNDDDNPDVDRPVSPPTPTPTPGSFPPPFDENFYLTQNPGVALAVANGEFANGLDHYLQFGQFEGRAPSAQLAFDVTFYLTVNPGVALAVANREFTSGLEHYILFGFSEGRSPVAT